MTLCVAHRGGSALAPENTLAAFAAGVQAGADWVECDVHRTQDGELVVLHDEEMSRTTDRSGRVGSMALAAVRDANAAAQWPGPGFLRQRVPTMSEVLASLGSQTGIQVEIKVPSTGPYPNIEQAVGDRLRAAACVDRCLVMSFDLETVLRCATLASTIPRALLVSAQAAPPDLRKVTQQIVHDARYCAASVAGLDRRLASRDLVDALQAAGLAVAVWTVNDEPEMEQLAAMGLAAITTDRPDLLRRLLDARH